VTRFQKDKYPEAILCQASRNPIRTEETRVLFAPECHAENKSIRGQRDVKARPREKNGQVWEAF
jgi:Zn finger protein HypA/HybF involved in hydrogenase expression